MMIRRYKMIKQTASGILLVILGVGFTACQQYDNFIGRPGVECDSKRAVSLTQNILNNQVLRNGNLKLDVNNIVIWNYNKVGRYTCKAKVSGSDGAKTVNPFLLRMYGLSINPKTSKISGWIKYDTYKTTKGNNFYVQIDTIKR